MLLAVADKVAIWSREIDKFCIWGWDNLLESIFVRFSYYIEDLPWISWRTVDRPWKYYYGKSLKFPKVPKAPRSMNNFTTEMFIFANFVQKVSAEQSQLQKLNIALPEFYLLVLSSLQVLGECCFKAPKVPLDEYFYYQNVCSC